MFGDATNGSAHATVPTAGVVFPPSAYVMDARHEMTGRLIRGGRLPPTTDSIPPAYGVARIGNEGTDGLCGCPWGDTGDLHMQYADEPPPELRDIFAPQEWTGFTKKFAQIVYSPTAPHTPRTHETRRLTRAGHPLMVVDDDVTCVV
jgi:hypothetical protein